VQLACAREKAACPLRVRSGRRRLGDGRPLASYPLAPFRGVRRSGPRANSIAALGKLKANRILSARLARDHLRKVAELSKRRRSLSARFCSSAIFLHGAYGAQAGERGAASFRCIWGLIRHGRVTAA
jgi:hypothetical protein